MALAAYLAGIAGLLIVYQGLRRDTTVGVALLTTLLLAAGTSLLLALVSQAVPAALSFAIVATLVFAPVWLHVGWARFVTWPLAILAPIVASQISDAPHATASLFAPDRGLLSLHPTAYVAAVGVLASVRANPFWTVATLVAITTWIVAGADLTAAVALLAPGLAAVIDWARRHPVAAVAPLVAAAIVWNYWLMVQYTLGTIPKDAPVSFAAMVRQQADVHTRTPYVYPFAFPANVLFAWREGVPVSRYDTLSAEPFRESFDMSFARGNERFLLDGWGPPGVSADGPYRWIDGPQATLVFRFIPPVGTVSVSVVASAQGEPAAGITTVTVQANGHTIGRAAVSPRATATATFTIPAASVGRVLRAGYNRLTIVTSGTHRIAIHHVRIAPAS